VRSKNNVRPSGEKVGAPSVAAAEITPGAKISGVARIGASAHALIETVASIINSTDASARIVSPSHFRRTCTSVSLLEQSMAFRAGAHRRARARLRKLVFH
jgi:hypothetical protein